MFRHYQASAWLKRGHKRQTTQPSDGQALAWLPPQAYISPVCTSTCVAIMESP
ncbi:hypothetical protein PCLA_09r0172 [Pseudomonas citronellolis]|nr:hypothetical protein PCLA_09r0172 [Pseudomonas citronellolis]